MYGAVLWKIVSKSGPGIFCAAIALSVAGCRVNVDYGGTTFLCAEGGVCPDGFVCIGDRCVLEGEVIDSGVDEPDAAPSLDPALIGNIVYYPFEGDYDGSSVAFDRGPNHIPSGRSGAVPIVAGKYGFARNFDDEDDLNEPIARFMTIPDSPRLFSGNTVTIEAWVRPDEAQAQAIVSDFDAGDAPETEYSLELTAAGDLAFFSSSACAINNETVATTGQAIPIDVFTHVAITWDGTEVVFYIDGAAVATEPFAHVPCEFPGTRLWRIGRRDAGARNFSGDIDEVKVSDYAKTAAQIVDSMNFDPTAVYPICGDLFIEGSEECEGQTECCDLATCAFEADGASCSNGGTCQSGVCTISGAVRVDSGLLALYEFNEASGSTVVGDSIAPALDLTITDPLNVTFDAGTMTINTSTRIGSAVAATKISDACKASRELTMEAWVTPANDTQGGPARILTLSLDAGDRNFTLGQGGDLFVGRIRTSISGANGTPVIATPPSSVDLANLNHVVVTRKANGERRIYVNGILVGFDLFEGSFSNWNNTWLLGLGNEFVDNRTWLGTLALAAVYERALSDAEVMQNFSAGP